ncbi:Alpha/beta hydrolase family protein [compost metagenome]
MIANAYAALLSRVGPSAIVCHSQGGVFGLRAAITNPDRVKAIVALEPAAVPMDAIQVHGLQVPTLIVLGDHMNRDARWPLMRKAINAFAAQSPLVQILDLPAIGITGNSHMLMMDTNSEIVARHVLDWLARKLIA